MKRNLLLVPALICGLSYASPVWSQEQAPPPASVPADNTALNARDKNGDTLTPMSQSESKPDLELAARVRRAIVKDRKLSTTAKNIKVITQNGTVTLRGPVRSEMEKADIVQRAKRIAGEDKVNDQLDIAAK